MRDGDGRKNNRFKLTEAQKAKGRENSKRNSPWGKAPACASRRATTIFKQNKRPTDERES